MQLKPQLRLERIFDVAHNWGALGSANVALKRIFVVTGNKASCDTGPELAVKYKVPQDNQQYVMSVTNRYTLEQTWFNEARTQKPHTFSQAPGAEIHDPTNNGAKCDFCSWPTLTATDPGFQRIELPHAVTGSNLFKYAEPSHGIVLFKHHQPLEFSQEALADMLDASWLWFQASHKLNPRAVEPFFLWNCLPRAGASQYHGHAQVMLTDVAVPAVTRIRTAAETYKQHHAACYYADLLKAHASVGLLRQVSIPAAQDASSSTATKQQDTQDLHTAWGFASLVPYKDMEVYVVGRHICCPAFQKMLHAALRALIDGLGCRMFNVGVSNLDLSVQAPAGVGMDRQFWNSSSSRGSSCRTDGASIESAVISNNESSDVPYTAREADTDAPEVTRNNLDGNHSRLGAGLATVQYEYTSQEISITDVLSYNGRPPVLARLVSRGKLSAAAVVTSDFGGLEVFGGASIGHTDPFLVVQHLDMQLSRQQ